ncbi:hypothetical protein [Streptomyces sp. NPDC101249]|uniref:hypothetical protein n=1 Tax=Streptomyces sp. NPDC101249 TaxID=3366140 RepID=UPI00380EC07A
MTTVGTYILTHDWAAAALLWTLTACVLGLWLLAAYAVVCAGRHTFDAIVDCLPSRRVPAAPDNIPGRDTDALITCRRIHAATRKENQT